MYIPGVGHTFCVNPALETGYTDDGTIQISRIIDLDQMKVLAIEGETAIMTAPSRYIYEEINRDDIVTYTRYMGLDNIGRCYAWALPALT